MLRAMLPEYAKSSPPAFRRAQSSKSGKLQVPNNQTKKLIATLKRPLPMTDGSRRKAIVASEPSSINEGQEEMIVNAISPESSNLNEIPTDLDDVILQDESGKQPTLLLTRNCDSGLIAESRRLLEMRYRERPESFCPQDYERMMTDDWTISRFLLRRRLDPLRAVNLMEECSKLRKRYSMSELKLSDFPVEVLKLGGVFKYERDRVGNVTIYVRVKLYRRVKACVEFIRKYLLCIAEDADRANNGRGVAIILDLTGAGLQNVDLRLMYWFLLVFKNQCPKGLGYVIVYNLPWFLRPTSILIQTWISERSKKLLRFVCGAEIEEYIEKKNLPDFLGGTCKTNYRAVPEGARPLRHLGGPLNLNQEQVCEIEYICGLAQTQVENYEQDSGDTSKDKDLVFEDASQDFQ